MIVPVRWRLGKHLAPFLHLIDRCGHRLCVPPAFKVCHAVSISGRRRVTPLFPFFSFGTRWQTGCHKSANRRGGFQRGSGLKPDAGRLPVM